MADWGYNPPHGWAQGPWDSFDGLFYQDPSGWAPAAHGFFPAPPGFGWYELPGDGVGGYFGDFSGGLSLGGYGGMCGTMPCDIGGMGGIMGYPGLSYLGVGGGGGGGGQSWQQIGLPVDDGGIPGVNIKNSTEGIGLEPGYNYIFPKEHCKIHAIKSATPPWQNEGDETFNYTAHVVPTCVTLKTLLQQFGCDNADPGKNVLHEVVPGGGGKWYRGLTIKGDNGDLMKKAVSDMGWNEKRDGKKGEVVWVYFTKD
ncbi:hypothetical protein VE00_00113 [Pseudogymnoascus sp. WSF 3629]|nr:hypothetical protein VE00_00113 [Pseudogymnoascus sp. WSF 3629]